MSDQYDNPLRDALKHGQEMALCLQIETRKSEALQAQLAEAHTIIEFYASDKPWITKRFNGNGEFIEWFKEEYRDRELLPYKVKEPKGEATGNWTIGGKRARAYMAKLKGE